MRRMGLCPNGFGDGQRLFGVARRTRAPDGALPRRSRRRLAFWRRAVAVAAPSRDACGRTAAR
eukprot:9352644-Lingulodinium_polyedra.AAC.1